MRTAMLSEESSATTTSTSISHFREFQCIGRLEIVRPKPAGFLCGSIPVITDNSFDAFHSYLMPSHRAVSAPRYRMLPMETDLNMLPVVSNLFEKGLRVAASQPSTTGEFPWNSDAVSSNLSRKCEALAVYGLVEHGDDVDVIAPADILKQIFRMPYCKARLSIAVRRVGQTLVLNNGPDAEEGEKLVQSYKGQPKCVDQSMFVNFAMHSVRMEACDCPPTPRGSGSQSHASILPMEPVYARQRSEIVEQSDAITGTMRPSHRADFKPIKMNGLLCEPLKKNKNKNKKKKKKEKRDMKQSPIDEKKRCFVGEGRIGNDNFLRILFWKFHNFRMLLGSDMLVFSNEKYVAVSLHLWDVAGKVTPMTWLEAWLDNVMASVPEMAICYHRNGVVQGYELLKTDDIFLLKGISEDGAPAFLPHVVQQNGLSVFRFLQENCMQDPGAFWLYKGAGEDMMQLFDVSVMPSHHGGNGRNDDSSPLPSPIHSRRSKNSSFSLGTLLYRVAHRLFLVMQGANHKAKCARLFRQCLEFLEDPSHLVVRSLAHEQFARLLLDHSEDLDLASESVPSEPELETGFHGATSDGPAFIDWKPGGGAGSEASLSVCKTAAIARTVADPISSKVAAIRHVSQAIMSLRWMRQLQGDSSGFMEESSVPGTATKMKFCVCACGDPNCIDVCDINEWLPMLQIDHKLWKLVLLLGEAYLALARTYKEDDQLGKALRMVELACSIYGSMPRELNGIGPRSSFPMVPRPRFGDVNDDNDDDVGGGDSEQLVAAYMFWYRAWALVGDVHVKFHFCYVKGEEILFGADSKSCNLELRLSAAVMEELQRLKMKLGQDGQNCSSCSLVNCSCQCDRASSGSNASCSSSTGENCSRFASYGRNPNFKSGTLISKHGKRCYARHSNSSGTLISNPQLQCLSSPDVESMAVLQLENDSEEEDDVRPGGIFKFLRNRGVRRDGEYSLTAALSCYREARRALNVIPTVLDSGEARSVMKKIGWVCNEIGRKRLENKRVVDAELAFEDAISAFRDVSDHTNVILICCNLGHGRRALAEEMVGSIAICSAAARRQAVEAVRWQYVESLRYYRRAKLEFDSVAQVHSNGDDDDDEVRGSLKSEVETQVAHTSLRLGMFLARECSAAEVRAGHEISAMDFMAEALSIYDLLGEVRKQEAAYAHFQLASCRSDCVVKLLEPEGKRGKKKLQPGDVFLERAKQHASLAEAGFQNAIEFYGPKTHSVMYLTILTKRSDLMLSLYNAFQSHSVLGSALQLMLEGRHVPEMELCSFEHDHADLHARFWRQLQQILKLMLAAANKSASILVPTPQHNRIGDAALLRELNVRSLKSTDLSHLQAMHTLWTSNSRS